MPAERESVGIFQSQSDVGSVSPSGTAAYDSVHDLLYVANVNGPTIQVYSNAHLMTSASGPAGMLWRAGG